MNKCEKCGFLHYRTDPCRKPKVRIGTEASDNAFTTPKSSVSAEPPSDLEVHTQSAAAPSYVPVEGSVSPVDAGKKRQYRGLDTAGRKPVVRTVASDTDPIKFDKKAWMREYMREYMRKRRAK